VKTRKVTNQTPKDDTGLVGPEADTHWGSRLLYGALRLRSNH